MRVAPKAQPGRSRRARWTRDRRANMQVVEVMIVGLLVVSAVVAVSTMNVPVTETEGFKQDNERLVKDSLDAMSARPSQKALFGSTLEEYVMEAIAGQPGLLMDYLNKTLPGGAAYNVYLDNHYGPPRAIVKQGQAPREAVAGSTQMVPKLAYTFMVPEFEFYHGDFHMNMYAVPVQSGVLLHDEGESVEVAITYQQLDETGQLTKEPITMRTYTHTALRNNDPSARSWPSVAMTYWNTTNNADRHEYKIDRNIMMVYDDRIHNDPPTPFSGDAYNITWTMRLTETAGVKVPKNTVLTIDVPRGYDFNATKQEWLAEANGAYWKDWTFGGNMNEGWIIKIKTKETFKAEAIDLLLSSNFRTVLDTAYPFYTPLTFTLGDGVLGETHLIIDVPQQVVVGAFGREAYVSVTKPLISGDQTTWGIAFGNNGEAVQIHDIVIRQPDGKALLADVEQANGWKDGTWLPVAGKTSEFQWTPTGTATVGAGKQMWLTLDVTAATLTDNNFRNQDYLRVESLFNPTNGTGAPNTIDEFNYTERLYRMGEEWVYRDAVPPYDDVPGWSDQELRRYWATGGTYGYQKVMEANTSYSVLPTGIGANAFGGYQGAHVASHIDIVDRKGNAVRDFALGENVHIRNDFSALFAELSRLQAAGTITVNDVKVRTDIYTPERAWKGVPTTSFEEDASLASQFASIKQLLSEDLTSDGVPDLVALGSDGKAYGVDGRDGAKLWTIDTTRTITSGTLRDVDADGRHELLLGFEDARLGAYDTDTTTSPPTRELWMKDLTPLNPFGLGTYRVTDIVATGLTAAGEPDTVVAVSAVTGEAQILGLDTSLSSATTISTYDASALTDVGEAFVYDIVKVMWSETGTPEPHVAFASAKKTVTMLTLPDLAHVWSERVPHTVDKLYAIDADNDGNEDLVADTVATDPLATDGHYVFTLTGDSGDFAPQVRLANPTGAAPLDASSTAASLVAVDGTTQVLMTVNADYDQGPAVVTAHGSTLGNDGFYGLHVASNGTVFIVSNGGTVYYNRTYQQAFAGWDWQLLNGEVLPSIFRDLHVSPTLGSGGPVLLFDNKGGIWKSDTGQTGSYAKMAQACISATLPHADLDCATVAAADFLVQEDAFGEADHIWMVASAGGMSYLLRYDVDAATWTKEGTWTFDARSVHLAPDGGTWVTGGETGRPVLYERPPGSSSWRTHTLWRNATSDRLEAVMVQADGTAWAASKDGGVWKRTSDRVWVPFFIDGYSNSGQAQFVETVDGEPWLIADEYDHVPLRLFDRSSYADFVVDGFDTAMVSVQIDSVEGHLGGQATPLRAATTSVSWFARPLGGSIWQPLITAGAPNERGIYNITHTMGVGCAETMTCEKLELRAYLKNTHSQNTDPVHTMGGATPVLRSFLIKVTDDDENERIENVIVDQDSMRPSSTAVYSQFRGGAIQATARTPWTYFGEEESSVLGAQKRLVAASPTDLQTGGTWSQVAIVNEVGSTLERWVLNATSGLPAAPSDLSSFGFTGTNKVHQMILTPLVGGSQTDVAMAGTFDGQEGSLLAWDVATDTDHLETGLSKNDATALVASGYHDARPTVTFGDGQGLLNSLAGSPAGDKVTLRWTNAPGTAQGQATFVYAIPMDALYGTAVVVSELTFDMTESGIPVTQTARMVDWFDMRPPDRDVPRPPIYTIQIVSWFNEA